MITDFAGEQFLNIFTFYFSAFVYVNNPYKL